MIEVHDITNSIFTSKTYIIYKEGTNKAWLVAIGDIEPVIAFIEKYKLDVAGVFITHGHFDHIYGLHSLIEHYPNCEVYTTEFGKQSLASDKLNMSRYHEMPFQYTGDNER